MDPYAPKKGPMKGMHSYCTKPVHVADGDTPDYVSAGQWWNLSDMPGVELEGDGGEGRAIKVNEDGEVLFRVYPGDWVVETSPEVFEKFTNEEFNEHFMSMIEDTLALKMKPEKESTDGAQEINRPTRYEENQKKKHDIKERKLGDGFSISEA